MEDRIRGGNIYGGGPVSKNKKKGSTKNNHNSYTSTNQQTSQSTNVSNKGEAGLIEQNRMLRAEIRKLKARIKELEG